MVWHFPLCLPPPETIKLTSCRNLIQHYLGNYLENLTLDQLSVNLCNGTGTVSDVTLNCEAINEFGNNRNWPVKIVEGHMKDITLKVPWSNVFNDESICKVNGLSLTIQPKTRPEPVRSLLKWVLSNWSTLSSKQLLNINNKGNDFDSHAGQGEEMFAESIVAILKRLKVKLENTQIRIEHLPKRYNSGVILDVHIRTIECYDEGVYTPVMINSEYSDTYNKRRIKIEGVTLYTHKLPLKRRTAGRPDNSMEFHRSSINFTPNKPIFDYTFNEMESDISAPGPQIVKDINLKEIANNWFTVKTNQNLKQPGPILIAVLNGQQEMTLTFKQSDISGVPVIETNTNSPIVIVLSPRQIDSVVDLLKDLMKPQPGDTSFVRKIKNRHDAQRALAFFNEKEIPIYLLTFS